MGHTGTFQRGAWGPKQKIRSGLAAQFQAETNGNESLYEVYSFRVLVRNDNFKCRIERRATREMRTISVADVSI
jgi:hypothetical protein